MKSLLKFSVACALCAALVAPDALAFEPVPHMLNVQGVLRNSQGEVVTGTYTINFALYTAETGGSSLYGPETQVLTITGGVFSSYIGPVVDSTFVNRTDVWLGIKVGSDPELPRKRMTATGFAFQAEHAEKADELLGAATDVSCTGCVDNTDVSIPYARGVAADGVTPLKAGAAADVACLGCISGGANATQGDLGSATVQNYNMAPGAINTTQLVDGAVTNAKLGTDAVKTGNILDGTILAQDIAGGAITSTKIAAGAVTNNELGVLYALSDAKGGDALGLKCGAACVDPNEVTFFYAAGVDAAGAPKKGGAASDVVCTSCVADTEVSFTFARSDAKNGPALDLKCGNGTIGQGCVDNTEVSFNYASSTIPNGPANDLNCTSCVGDSDLGIAYARGVASDGITPLKAGAAADVVCTGCIGATDVSFNYAAGDGVAGNATGLICTNCVDSSDIKAGAVTDVTVGTGIKGDKITVPGQGGSTRGTIYTGSGLNMDANGLVTVNFGTTNGTAAQGDHTHSNYYVNPSTPAGDLNLAHGKKFNILDTDDYVAPSGPGHYAYFTQGTVGNSGTTSVRLVLGPESVVDKEWFEIYSDSSPGFIAHKFDASGAAYHKGNVTLASGAQISCTGCVGSTAIGNNVVSANIVDGSIAGGDLAPAINIVTSGTIKSTGGMYAPRYYDTDDSSSTYYADPFNTSVMNVINYNTLSARGIPSAANFMGLNAGVAYLDSINTDTVDANLEIANSRCSAVTMFGGSCGGRTLTVYGPMLADKLTDNAGGGLYVVDPEQTTTLRYLNVKTNDSWLGNPNGNNYLRGTTYAFTGTWYDENGTYYLDPSVTSKFKDVEADWIRLPNRGSFPGNANGYSQIVNSGGNLYLSPDYGGGAYLIGNFAGDDRFYINLNGGRPTSRASIGTNGNYIFMNSSVYDPRIYLNWDVGGNTYVGGNLQGNNFIDVNATSCQMTPRGTTTLKDLYAEQFFGYRGRVSDLYVYGSMGLGGGDVVMSPGCTGTVCAHIGGSNAGFKSMWSMYFNAYSQRDMKRDIHYLDEHELNTTIADQLHNLKPVTYYYKVEKPLGDPTASRFDVRTVPHVGLIQDEMPGHLLSSEGGWSMNDSVGFLLVGAKYLEDQNRAKEQKIKDLEDRVALMEQALVDAGLIK